MSDYVLDDGDRFDVELLDRYKEAASIAFELDTQGKREVSMNISRLMNRYGIAITEIGFVTVASYEYLSKKKYRYKISLPWVEKRILHFNAKCPPSFTGKQYSEQICRYMKRRMIRKVLPTGTNKV
jgi:hypothetical protein